MVRFTIIVLLVLCVLEGRAQTAQDTVYAIPLKPVQVNARFMNDTDRYRFNQTRYYVTTILPYLDAAVKLFNEMNAKLADPTLTKRERKEYVSRKEDEMRDKFEDKVTELNVTQGVLLVKLIARQTDVNIYHMLNTFKNPLTAMKWQAWARLHGLNLDRKYHPEEEPMLEVIMEGLGYPLPAAYAVNNN